MESELAHSGEDQRGAARMNTIDHRCHHVKKVKNFKYLNMPPKETVYSK